MECLGFLGLSSPGAHASPAPHGTKPLLSQTSLLVTRNQRQAIFGSRKY